MPAPKLERHIGLIALTLYGVGDILGAGIYGLVGKAAGLLGNGVWLAFLVGFSVALLSGLTYASLCSRYPRAAGSSYVVLKAFGSGFGAFVVGLTALFSGLTSMAAASRIFGNYFHGLAPWLPPEIGAVVFLTLIALILWRGIRESIVANSILTLCEVGGLLIVIGVGASFLGSVDYTNFVTPENPAGTLSGPLLLSATVLVFYSFVGFEDIINVGEEVKEPHRTLPRGLIFALLIASAIYFLVSLVAISVVPAAELAASSQPLVEVVARAAPWFPRSIFSVISLLAVSNTALLNFLMGSRLLYGLARLRVLPKFLDHVSAKRKTPTRAILLVYFIALALCLTGEVSTLARATSLLLLLVFITMNLSLLKIKFAERNQGVSSSPKDPAYFRVPAIVPALGFAGCLVLLFFGKAQEWLTAGILLAVIIGLYGIVRPKHEAITRMVQDQEK
ncbi:MAG: amino acid permease [Proteobacteria bacterium]|nr:MAG: amino acid permease [Pseudomonadota bacterium]